MIGFFAVIIGLCVGSFLNVVIYRFPKILAQQWREECHTYLALENTAEKPESFSLAWPGSHCPSCKKALKPWHNIPVISYLFLRGRCAYCAEKISIRYPIIEFLTAVLTLWAIVYYGVSIEGLSAVLFTWFLITISMIDLDHQIIPDNLSYSLLWIGLLLSLFDVFVDSETAIIGALCGYLSLWSITYVFKLITGKQGMGHGDFKLFAAFGAWMGWQPLLLIILIASSLGAVIGIASILVQRMDRNTPLPFGPFLAFGGWVASLNTRQALVEQ